MKISDRWQRVLRSLKQRDDGFSPRADLHKLIGLTFSKKQAITEHDRNVRQSRKSRKLAAVDAPLPKRSEKAKVAVGRNNLAGNWLRGRVKSGQLLDETRDGVRGYCLTVLGAEGVKPKPKVKAAKKAKAKPKRIARPSKPSKRTRKARPTKRKQAEPSEQAAA